MEKVHDTVSWYQQKIGSYDKQLWEQSVEQKVLKGLQQAPRRSVRPKTGLIDVDLIRGSTFTKTKPQVPWTYVTAKTFSRVVLFPFHYQWWIQQTSFPFWLFLMVLYILQVFTFIVFFNNVGDNITQDEQGLGEVMIPFVLMVLLGLIHSQTILTHLKPPVRDNKRDGWRRKRSLSQNRSTSDNAPNSAELSTASKSNSGSKTHISSRPLRDRTKERKGRLKGGNTRSGLRRELLNATASQDSESAYLTYEASDSVADRTSSVEAESNIKETKSSDSGPNIRLNGPSRVTPHVSTLYGCEKRNSSNLLIHKAQESQESDLPEDSNSEDEHLLKPGIQDVAGNKRHSQSISSENEPDDCRPVVNKTGEDSSRTAVPNGEINHATNGTAKDKVIGKESRELDIDIKVNFEGQSHSGVDKIDGGKYVLIGEVLENGQSLNVKQSTCIECKNSIPSLSIDETQSEVSTNGSSDLTQHSDILLERKSQKYACSVMKRHSSSSINKITANSVHFTKDLVKLREITPLSSRETTPTHSHGQTDVQNKHLRGVNALNNCETDTDSEAGMTACKPPPATRRRKVIVQDCEDVGGTTLRHRRRASGHPERSSSENETEGHSSEYSRASRQNVASSEEWGDHLQTEVDTSSESSSCGSEPEISGNEEPAPPSDTEPVTGTAAGITSSHMHVINLLQPSRKQSTSQSSTSPDKVTCIIWERNECKKVELTAMDIGWTIIETVDKIPESSDYILIGFTFSILMGLTPLFFQAFHMKDLPAVLSLDCVFMLWELTLASTWRQNLIHINAIIQRLFLSALFFFLLSVADRTFKQRLLYAKHFCYLTSSRRARKFDLPHFRLNKVRNIKTWLSLRSYLKKRGPQRSVDVIVSFAFLITLIMLILMCLQLLRDAEIYLNYLCNWEILVWCMALGVYLLRFMTLGLRINKKYRNLSVLITEQINLYLQMEQKPHKKEELMVANNVLKLAESLLKELESPFKISGISANPLVLNVTRVVVLSAFSAVLTELLGFKLKLYKIKLRA